MAEDITTQQCDIPSFSDEIGKRQISTDGKSILDIVNESLMEYRTSIKGKISELEQRIAVLEKTHIP